MSAQYKIAPFGRDNILGYLSADIICSVKRTKTVSFVEHITSKDIIFCQGQISQHISGGYCA